MSFGRWRLPYQIIKKNNKLIISPTQTLNSGKVTRHLSRLRAIQAHVHRQIKNNLDTNINVFYTNVLIQGSRATNGSRLLCCMSVRKGKKQSSLGHVEKITVSPRIQVVKIVVIGKHFVGSPFLKVAAFGKKPSVWNLLLLNKFEQKNQVIHPCGRSRSGSSCNVQGWWNQKMKNVMEIMM